MSRIVVIDDHPVMRESIAKVIELEIGLEFCGSAGSVEEACELIERVNPDLVLTDLNLGERSGIELIKELQTRDPELPVLVVSMHDELIYAERVLRAGGRGFVWKGVRIDEFVGAIHQVLRSGIYMSEEVARSFSPGVRSDAESLASMPLRKGEPRPAL